MMRDSGKYDDGAADGNWENCARSQGAYFEGNWGITVLCAMFLVSSLVNVSIFHSTWLDTFWTDLSKLQWKKEWSTDMLWGVKSMLQTQAKWKKPSTKGYILPNSSYMKITEQVNPERSRVIVARNCWEGMRSNYKIRRFLFWGDKNVLELDRNVGVTPLWMY